MKIVIRAIAHWFWILILCLLAGWFGGKELTVLIPPTYQATALVQLNAQSHTSSIIQPVAAYSALITSDRVLGTALKKYPQLDRTAVATKQLTVATDNGSQTITISVTLPNAKEAAGLANDLAQLLVTQQNAVIEQQYAKELQIINSRIAGEKQSVDQLNQKIISTPATDTTAIQQLQSQVQQYQNLENQDITSQQTLQTQQALYANPLSVVQRATPPTKPSSIIGTIPLTPVFLAVMLLLGVFIIYMLERASDRINSMHALQQKKIVPILGALRWSGTAPQNIPLKQICEAKTPYAEDCRVMMADILFHAENAQAHILAVTSIKSRAGSSSIAAELAALLAHSKRRVLLIDANLTMPSLYKRLGIPNGPGLAQMLEEAHRLKVPATPGGPQSFANSDANWEKSPPYKRIVKPDGVGTVVTLEEAHTWKDYLGKSNRAMINPAKTVEEAHTMIVPVAPGGSRQPDKSESGLPFESYIMQTGISNLFMVPAGKPSTSPANLLSMPEMKQFLDWAERRGDYIVIDCPALTYAEAHVLGSLSDQTFLVIDATRDRIKQVESIREELLNTGVKLSGFIANKLGRWI